ncbi:YegP family protein [Anseongella ginsenosidimutans]|uniref:YegP family protein n=1 Tax=Anseongella ginsenosidimutans TaxID=496056 RepID=UPI001CEF7BDD|nr:YegP family protein [Anseongella ginsenosidimutans]
MADTPDQPIERKVFHSRFELDQVALNAEEDSYQPLPVIRKVDPAMVQRNYEEVKKDVQNIVYTELQRMMNDPQLEGLVVRKEGQSFCRPLIPIRTIENRCFRLEFHRTLLFLIIANHKIMGKFTTKTAQNGQFYFNLKAGNGEIILTSEMYTTRSARDNGIESLERMHRRMNAMRKNGF